MREANNQQLGQLHDKIKQLKGLTQEIHVELREQNSLLDVMNDSTSKGVATLKSTMSKLGHVMKSGGNSHMYMLMAFVSSCSSVYPSFSDSTIRSAQCRFKAVKISSGSLFIRAQILLT